MDEEKEHPNHTIRNSVYNNFESLSASALKVFWKLFRLRMQATELRDGRRTSVNDHFIVRQDLSKQQNSCLLHKNKQVCHTQWATR